MRNISSVIIESCLKKPDSVPGKAISPKQTLVKVRKILEESGRQILRETRRIDSGRLNIPVYMSICAPEARALLPTRKQMGKGASAEQAEASAVMELMERHAFFGFWQRIEDIPRLTWKEAKKLYGSSLISEREVMRSVQDDLSVEAAASVLELMPWLFHPATHLSSGASVWLPVDWFRMLGEFNGSSAGNTTAESVLQGLCELIERHVCCIASKSRTPLPTITTNSCGHPVLASLIESFQKANINLILKDMSMGMPVPTVAALAWDPVTFPDSSEIVFTAGTATSPEMAAIRAITEVAQLGGDFHTSSCYEASGLPKYSSLEECAWLTKGPQVELTDLPMAANDDMLLEIRAILGKLAPFDVYAIATTDPGLKIPAHWIISPGLQFRERDEAQSLGLFVGRKLAEEAPFTDAMDGLEKLAKYYPDAHFLPFFRGLTHLRHENPEAALAEFHRAIPLQPHQDAEAMTNFYAGHTLGLMEKWREALPYLSRAFDLCPQVSEYGNLAGVACYHLGAYEEAENFFDRVLKQNRGSAMDLANRGVCRKFLGRFAEARADLENALELDPSLNFARKHLSEISA